LLECEVDEGTVCVLHIVRDGFSFLENHLSFIVTPLTRPVAVFSKNVQLQFNLHFMQAPAGHTFSFIATRIEAGFNSNYED